MRKTNFTLGPTSKSCFRGGIHIYINICMGALQTKCKTCFGWQDGKTLLRWFFLTFPFLHRCITIISRADFHWVQLKGSGMQPAAQEAARPISLRARQGRDIPKIHWGRRTINPFFISSWTLITRKDGVPIRHFWLWWYLILLFVESNDVVSLSKGWVACSLSPSLVTVSSFLVNPLQLLDAKNNPEDFCFNQGMMQLPLTVV